MGDYLRHLSIANGSLMELETHLLIAEKLNYLPTTDVERILSQSGEVSRMLTGLTKKLRQRTPANEHLAPNT